MPSPADWLAQLPPPAAYGLLAGLVFTEGILVISPFVPTLGPLLVAGALVYAGVLEPWAVVLAASVGAICGDALGHWTGRHLGPRLRETRFARRVPRAWDRASELFRRSGGPALVPCRFVPLVRSAAPHLIGASGLPYRRMAPWSALAGVVWACGEGSVGYLAGASYSRLAGAFGAIPAVAVLVLVVLGVVYWRRRGSGGADGSDRSADAADRADLEGADPDRAGPEDADPEGAGPAGTRPDRADPVGAGAGAVEPGVADAGGADRPGRAGPRHRAQRRPGRYDAV
ncbi:DedA family protein [Saccharopolyspora sp. 6M]|uniref:DedA family protein n=1 Tax=Saccharopolyspora sp. 6M TaxID=2877237 RepID=UPI001CD39E8E|nr:DedA family protein [Saccharopolyspora sp. 6M]MCA1224655.1 DedA family protein [Saccharopolyspora sp. 6M]